MQRIVLAFAALTLSASIAVAQSGPGSQIRLAQAASCSSWNSTCSSRCADDACRKNVCGQKMSSCLSSGCWVESAANGGARHCGLMKK